MFLLFSLVSSNTAFFIADKANKHISCAIFYKAVSYLQKSSCNTCKSLEFCPAWASLKVPIALSLALLFDPRVAD